MIALWLIAGFMAGWAACFFRHRRKFRNDRNIIALEWRKLKDREQELAEAEDTARNVANKLRPIADSSSN